MKTNLLSNKNLKLEKNEVPTWGLSLVPHKMNSFGINLCENANIHCINGCIVSSGMARFDAVMEARIKKTDFFLSDKPRFLKILFAELCYIDVTEDLALIRLNMYSDVDWYSEFLNHGYDLTKFKNLIFYGYTKRPSILEQSSELSNFDCIFSYSGYNWKLCEHYLNSGICNVSIVFKLKKKQPLPTTWNGFPVLDGDLNDQRLKSIEGTGYIIALRYKSPVAKGSKSYKPSKFVIELSI
jgi:hypothetical protein